MDVCAHTNHHGTTAAPAATAQPRPTLRGSRWSPKSSFSLVSSRRRFKRTGARIQPLAPRKAPQALTIGRFSSKRNFFPGSRVYCRRHSKRQATRRTNPCSPLGLPRVTLATHMLHLHDNKRSSIRCTPQETTTALARHTTWLTLPTRNQGGRAEQNAQQAITNTLRGSATRPPAQDKSAKVGSTGCR